MSTIARAAEVILGRTAPAAALALADAGLLAPELPEPQLLDGALMWGDVWVEDDDGKVYTDLGRSHSRLTPEEARGLGLALLAAADHAEEVGTDGQDN